MPLILLAVDETPESIEAVRRARSLFGPDATYLAVSVADQPVPWFPTPLVWGGVYPYVPYDPVPGPDVVSSAGEAIGDRARETAHQVAAQAGVAAAAVGDVGDPVAAILRAADDHAADAIVVGSSDKGWWRRLVEGSVSDDVVRSATQPVLVVHSRRER
jgi:nucleotide-binding universal stress UspA family protein